MIDYRETKSFCEPFKHPDDLKTHRLVSEDDVDVRHDLHQRLFEELADEGGREVEAEDLVVVRRVFGHFKDGVWRHGQEKTLQDGDQESDSYLSHLYCNKMSILTRKCFGLFSIISFDPLICTFKLA